MMEDILSEAEEIAGGRHTLLTDAEKLAEVAANAGVGSDALFIATVMMIEQAQTRDMLAAILAHLQSDRD